MIAKEILNNADEILNHMSWLEFRKAKGILTIVKNTKVMNDVEQDKRLDWIISMAFLIGVRQGVHEERQVKQGALCYDSFTKRR